MGSVTMEGIAGELFAGAYVGFGDTGAGVLTTWLPLEVTAFSKYYNFTYAQIARFTSERFELYLDQSSDVTTLQAWPFGDVIVTNITTAATITITAAQMGSETGTKLPDFFFQSVDVAPWPWTPATGDNITIEIQDIPEGQ